MRTMAVSEYYDAANDRGEGFPLGDESDSLIEALEREGYTYQMSDGDLQVAVKDGKWIAAGNAGGPFAVELPGDGPWHDGQAWVVNVTN